MRIVAGTFKGRPLQAVPGKGTRPTTDKVKESMFSMIGPYFDGGWALDLYAGTGGLGLEAISRGMDKAVFVDMDPKAIAVIKQNIAKVGVESQTEVYRNDANRALKALGKREIQFDLVFLDPPYAQQAISDQIQLMQECNLLSKDCWVVTEHDAQVVLPQNIGLLERVRTAVYGDTSVTIFRTAEQED